MDIRIKENSFFIFDLDDTLYPEKDFLRSGFRVIADRILKVAKEDVYPEMLKRYDAGENVFEWIVSSFPGSQFDLTITNLLKLYREHFPAIKLKNGAKEFLDSLRERNIPLGLITDGRSMTQRNKIKALGLKGYFQEVLISEEFGSEKPDEKNFLFFEERYPEKSFWFMGDNISKDFLVPEKLGWTTICLRDAGENIHPQNFQNDSGLDLIIDSFKELMNVISFDMN